MLFSLKKIIYKRKSLVQALAVFFNKGKIMSNYIKISESEYCCLFKHFTCPPKVISCSSLLCPLTNSLLQTTSEIIFLPTEASLTFVQSQVVIFFVLKEFGAKLHKWPSVTWSLYNHVQVSSFSTSIRNSDSSWPYQRLNQCKTYFPLRWRLITCLK